MTEPTRILIVEDTSIDAALAQREISRALQACVFECVETRQAYLNALTTFQPDLIISDYSMPHFDGMTALKLALEWSPLTPFIIWTGSLNEDIAVECMKTGAINYVLKDNLKRLGPAVIHALEERQVRVERQAAEEKLRESEARHRLIAELMTDYVYSGWLYPNGNARTEWISGAFEQITGFTVEEIQALPGGFSSLVVADDRDRVFAAQPQIVLNNALTIEYRIRCKNGEIRWLRDSMKPTRGTDQDTIHLVGGVQDITARKQTEQELQNSEAFNRTVLDSLFAHIAVLNSAGDIVAVNEPWRDFARQNGIKTLGGTVEQVNYLEVLQRAAAAGSESAQEAVEGILQVMQGRRSNFLAEYPCHSPTEERWFVMRVKGIVGTSGGVIITHENITERKRTEQSLALANERLGLAQRSSGAGVWDWDMVTGELTWSPEFFELFGLDPETVPATFDTWRGVLLAQDLVQAEAHIMDSISAHTPLSNEYRILLPSGEVRWIYALGNTTYDESGQPVRMTGICFDITERKRHARELEAMVGSSAALRGAITSDDMVPIVIQQVSTLFNTQNVALGLCTPYDDASTVIGASGVWQDTTGRRVPLEQSIPGHVLTTGKPYLVNDPQRDLLSDAPLPAGAVQCAVCVPLIAHGEAIGWLAAGVDTGLHDDDVRILNAIADIAGNALRRAALYERTQETARELERAYETTLEGWANALELRDQETVGHSRRVVQLTLALAGAMGIPPEELTHLRRGALLHDIGKMGIPDSVLLKHGTLNEREWEIMRRHPEYAYQLLAPIEYLRPTLAIPYCHHEKWDGTGYPRGLRGEEIPLAARIFAVVDVWDALTSDRPYRAAWSMEQANAYIRAEAGKHFDPRIVQEFFKQVRPQPENTGTAPETTQGENPAQTR